MIVNSDKKMMIKNIRCKINNFNSLPATEKDPHQNRRF